MKRSKLIERLSAIEHEQWVGWAKTLLAEEKLSDKRRQRWEACFGPYQHLPEHIKEFDRRWARKVLEECERAEMVKIKT